MATNTLLTIQQITNELLLRFKNNLGFSGAIQHIWDDKFAISGAKIGDSLRLREPVRFTVTKGRVATPQNIVETAKTLTLSTQAHVAFEMSSVERTLSIDQIRSRYLDSAAVALANQVDIDGLTLAYQSTGNSVGTPGTAITTSAPFWLAGEILDTFSTPMDGKRTMVIPPKTQTAALTVFEGKFQSSTQIKNQYERGRMGTMGGFEWVMDQNAATHVVGALGGAPTVTGASQTGSNLLTGAWTAGVAVRLKKGDTFTLPTVFSVNPVSGVSTGNLQQFVVTADTSSDGAGVATIPIYPPITVTGSTKTVTNSPAAGAPLTIIGAASTSTPQGIGFHEAAFCIGMAPLDVPQGVDSAYAASDPDTGVSIRCISDYDITNDLFIYRCDILYGHCAQRPEWAVRVQT